MKILQVIDSLPTGGGARFVVNLTNYLNKRNISTDVLLLDGTKTSFYEELKNSGCEIFSLTTGGRWNLSNVLRIIPYLNDYDIIHVHIFPGSYYVAAAKFISRSNTPIVFTEHNSQNRRAVHPVFKYIEKWVYSQFGSTVCLTDQVKEFVEKNVDPRYKLTVIENGVDIDAIKSLTACHKSDFGFTAEDRILLMSARFESQKDHETLIRSMALLPNNFKLLLAGDGTKRTYYEKLVNDLDLSHRILFLGNRNDIYKIMKMADYNILSSHYEGLSLSAIESLASGKPFIASNVAGLDFIKDAGLLFRQGNIKELADIILMLDADVSYYNEVAKNCLRRSQEYDINIMVDKYVNLYHSIKKK